MMRRLVWWTGAALAATALPLWADTVELTTGAKLEGTVVAYSNLHFHVSTADLKSTKHPAANVRRIRFEQRSRTVTMQTRNGPVEGQLVGFEANAFVLAKADGKQQQIPTIFVKTLALPPPGQQAEGVLGETEPTDNLVIPEAISHGEEVELKALLGSGKVTLLFFYGNLGPGVQCRLLNNYLDNVASKEYRVAVHKIDIGQWDSPVARQYQVKAIPRLDIYDSAGRLAQSVEGNRLPEITSALKKIR